MFYIILFRIKSSGYMDKDPFYGSTSLLKSLNNKGCVPLQREWPELFD